MSETVLATVRDYAELIEALRARIVSLGTTQETIDDVAGLPPRYTSKLFAPMTMRSLGRVSLGPLLGAMGLKLLVVEDVEALARVQRRMTRRRVRRNVSQAIVHTFSRRFLRSAGRKGGLNSRRNLSQRRRNEIGRALTRARLAKAQ